MYEILLCEIRLSRALFSLNIVTNLIYSAAPVRWYGESEFYCSIMKILAFFLIVITSLVVDLGGAPSGDRIGFRYWKDPVSTIHRKDF
jgi:amino acid transporter